MKKLHMLTAAAAVLLAITGPSLAAPRTKDASTARTYGDPNVPAYPYSSQYDAQYNAYGRGNQYAPTLNAPYPDRPYGAPDNW